MKTQDNLAEALKRASATQKPPALLVSNVMFAIQNQSRPAIRVRTEMTRMVLAVGVVILVVGLRSSLPSLISSISTFSDVTLGALMIDSVDVLPFSVFILITSLTLAVLFPLSVEAGTR